MATKLPKPAPVRNLGNELATINGQAGDALATRNPALLASTTGNLGALSGAMTDARGNEITSNRKLLGGIKALKVSNRQVQQATDRATAPTVLGSLLDSTAATALTNPTAGNEVLNNLVKTSGPSKLLSTMTDQATAGLNDNGALTPEEDRLATQGARASMASRGLNGGSPAVLADVMGRTEYVNARVDRERAYAAGTEQLGQSSRAGDLGVASTVQGAIDSGRTLGLNVNAQDLSKKQMDLGAETAAADYRLKTNPGVIAYNTPSMVPAASSVAAQTTAQADVYPQILSYGSDLNNTNTNMLESRYINAQNAQYATAAGNQTAASAKQASDSTTTSAAIAGGVVVAAAAAL